MFNPILSEQLASEHNAELRRDAAAWRRTTASRRRTAQHRVQTHVSAWRTWLDSLVHPHAIGCEV